MYAYGKITVGREILSECDSADPCRRRPGLRCGGTCLPRYVTRSARISPTEWAGILAHGFADHTVTVTTLMTCCRAQANRMSTRVPVTPIDAADIAHYDHETVVLVVGLRLRGRLGRTGGPRGRSPRDPARAAERWRRLLGTVGR